MTGDWRPVLPRSPSASQGLQGGSSPGLPGCSGMSPAFRVQARPLLSPWVTLSEVSLALSLVHPEPGLFARFALFVPTRHPGLVVQELSVGKALGFCGQSRHSGQVGLQRQHGGKSTWD